MGRNDWVLDANTDYIRAADSQAIGTTNALGEYPTSKPYTPGCVLSTMYHVLGINVRHEFHDAAQRPLAILNEGRAIEELV